MENSPLNVGKGIPKQNIRSNKWRLDRKVEIVPSLNLSSKAMLNLSLITDGKKFFPMDIKVKSQPRPSKSDSALLQLNDNHDALPEPLHNENHHILAPGPKSSFLRFRNVDTPQYILSLLVNKKDLSKKGVNNLRELSGVLTPLNTNDSNVKVSPKFLDPIPPPKLNGNILTLSPPKITEGIVPIGTYITLTTLVNTKKQNSYSIFNNRFRSRNRFGSRYGDGPRNRVYLYFTEKL